MPAKDKQVLQVSRSKDLRRRADEALRQSEELYRSLFENMLNGVAYCKMIFEQNQPQDFIYLSVNRTFETQTRLKNVVGKRVSEVIPGIRESDPELFEIYGRVALTGKPEIFETFLEALQMWFSISVYSPEKEYFVAVFDVITDRKRAEEELRASETKYRTVANYNYDWEFWIGPDKKFIYISPSCLRITGHHPEEFFANPHLIEEIIHPDDQAMIIKHLRAGSQEDQEVHEIEFRIFTRDGEERWLSHFCQPVYDEAGVSLGRRASNRDITERKRAEEALRESETKYRRLIENLNEGVWQIDKDACTTFVNQRMAEMLGFTVDEMLGKHLFEFMDERGVEIAQHNLERRQQGIKEQHDFEFVCKDGCRVYTILETTPITDENGHYIGAIAGVQNITARKEAEEKLRQSEDRYRSLVENIMDGLVIFRLPGGRLLYLNQQICKIYGYNRRQGLRLSFGDLIIPEEQERFQDWVQKQTQGENHAVVPQIFTGRRRDASTFMVEVAVAPVTIQEKPVFQGIIRDVSERERLRQQVQYAQRMQALGTLTAGIAHEIRTPLTVCSSAAQFIRDDDLDPEFRRQCLEKMLSGIARASAIIQNLLKFARPPEKVEAIRMDLGVVINETLALVANQARRQNVELRWVAPVAPIALYGLAGLLPQAFLSLFINALSAMPDGGILSISLEATNHEEVVIISDTGQGIAAADLPYIFDPFFTTNAAGQGTGLGLSVCYAIIKQHFGSIEVESTVGQGTRFTVRLPVSY